jgi:hypothetical protein
MIALAKRFFMIEPPHRERGLDQVQVPLRRAHTLNVKVAKGFRFNQKLFPAFRRHRAHRPGAARSWRPWSSGTAAEVLDLLGVFAEDFLNHFMPNGGRLGGIERFGKERTTASVNLDAAGPS